MIRCMGPDAQDRLRRAEATAGLSRATDLSVGEPMAHALRTCLIAVSLGRAFGLSERQLTVTYEDVAPLRLLHVRFP